MHFLWTFPSVPSWNRMFMLEAMTFKAAIQLEQNTQADDISVEAWSNLYHAQNPQGVWHAVPLHQTNHSATKSDVVIFEDAVILTSHGEFRFTFRARNKNEHWLWANDFMVDGIISVSPPFQDKWSQGPDFSHIIGGVHLGNFMAATVADKLGFSAVLNVADNLDLVPSKFDHHVVYKKIPMTDGAGNPIPEKHIQEAVIWLQEQDKAGRTTLVNCRAGIGRAGSTVVAYVFATHRHMSYDEAYQFVFSRRFVYPHKGLQETLYHLYPR